MLERLGQLITSGVFNVILPLAVIVVLALVALRLVDLAARETDKRIITIADDPDRRARLHTVRRVAKATARTVVFVLATLIALGTLGIDIGPALAAAGIFGLAVSLGAQTVIKDVIGGLIILIEDEYRVGDTVKIGHVTGDVERITLRRTDVRDADGALNVVPNGEVRIVANQTRDWSRALVEFNLGYDADVKRAVSALDGALVRLASDPRAKPYLLGEPEIFGWNDFSDIGVIVRLRAKVTAGKQTDVARVLREHALEALQAAGITVETRNQVALLPAGAAPAPAAPAAAAATR